LVADRYSYLSSVGWAVLIAYLLYLFLQVTRLRGLPRRYLATAVFAFVIGLVTVTRSQCRTWRDADSLWRNVLIGSPRPSPLVYNELGLALSKKNRLREALGYLETTCALQKRIVEEHPGKPGYKSIWAGYLYNRGLILADSNRDREALEAFRNAIKLQEEALMAAPHVVRYLSCLGLYYTNLGRLQQRMGLVAQAAESLALARRIRAAIPRVPALAQ
jgi:tetratricopeptide (TPR) repeat protein